MSKPEPNYTKGMRIVMIGSGPISLLKAILLAEQNPLNTITLIDTAKQIGGAWYSDLSPKGHEIECGCHIWSYAPTAYEYIKNQLGVKLVAMKPTPVFVTKKMRLPYSILNTKDTYQTLAKNTLTFKFKRIQAMSKDPNFNFRIFGKRNMYPAKGSMELIHALSEKIKSLPQISILLESSIDKIAIADKIEIELNGKQYEFDHLYLTYVSKINNLSVYNKPIQLKEKRVDYIHFLIQLNQPLNKKISYWRLVNDNVIHRITDISYQSNFEEHLILVGIKETAYYNTDELTLLKHIEKTLSDYHLIDTAHQLTKIKTHIYPTHYIEKDDLIKLNQLDPKMTAMYTPDLMLGLHYLLSGENSEDPLSSYKQ